MIRKTILSEGEVESTFDLYDVESAINLPSRIHDVVWIQTAFVEKDSGAGDSSAVISLPLTKRKHYRRRTHYINGKVVSEKKFKRSRKKSKRVKKRWVASPLSGEEKTRIRRAAVDQLRSMLKASGVDTTEMQELVFLIVIGSEEKDSERMEEITQAFLSDEAGQDEED